MTATAPALDRGADIDPALVAFTRAVDPMVHHVGGAWFFTPEAARAGAAIGITGAFPLYAVGRAGVLGDADPEVIASAFAFFPPEAVEANYLIGLGDRTPAACATAYAAALAAWATRVLADLPEADLARLADLARRVAAATRPRAMPLFAGWRAMPRPDHPAADVGLALQVLREMRGDLHIHAISAHRLTSLEAVLGGDGPQRAAELRYPRPYPDPATYQTRRDAAETLTDHLVAPSYVTLDQDEREELLHLLTTVDTAVSYAEHAATDAGGQEQV